MNELRGTVSLGLTLLLTALAGCGGSSSSTSNPTPLGTGVVKLVPPAACVPIACAGSTIDGIVITGPQVFTPFSITFTVTSTLPFAPPGSYTLSDASFIDSGGRTTGCPAIGFTVADGKTTTVTFTITNDVCKVTASAPT